VSKGTATDAEGRFKINIAKEKQTTIILSHVNYYRKEVLVSDSLFSGNLTVYLTPKEFQLSDIVVSAGLYEQRTDKLYKGC